MVATDPEWFWSRVAVGDGCWIWNGKKDRGGYGYPRSGDGEKCVLAHRISYSFVNGPIPAGLHILHRCDVSACVRPSHLFVGTAADNKSDSAAKGRHAHLRGEDNGHRKINDWIARRIRTEVGEGGAQRSVARRHGLSKSQVSRIVNGTAWAHVRDEDRPAALTAKDALDIRGLVAGGKTPSEVALRYGIALHRTREILSAVVGGCP